MDLAHPLGVPAGQIVVDGDHVNALAGEGVEVDGQGRHQGLALAGLHLGDPAEMQGRPAHQLHVEVALADGAPGRFPDGGEGLDQQVVDVLAPVQALAERHGPVSQGLVAERLSLGLEFVDVRHQRLQGPNLLAFAGAQDLGEDAHEPSMLPVAGRDGPANRRSPTLLASVVLSAPPGRGRDGARPAFGSRGAAPRRPRARASCPTCPWRC